MTKLTPKQLRFVDEYLIDLNATQAASRAGYSEKTAYSMGQRLLKNAEIQKYIKQRMKAREKRTEVTQDKVLKELAKVGFSDIKDFLEFKTAKGIVGYDNDGEAVIDWRVNLAVKDSAEVDGSLISEVSISKDGVFKFKLHDKMSALDKLGRHLGMFKDKMELTGKDGGPIETIDKTDPAALEARINELIAKRGN